jgi:5'-deoxynucleotidase YfbR-like HD superfamily hydrolase
MDHTFTRHNSRFGGMVKRYHEYPTISTQTNAEHSWQVARLYLALFKPDTKDAGRVLIYIQFHDSGELGVGDMPFPIKANNPDLKETMNRLESQSLQNQGLVLPELTPWERVAVKVCDLMEMLEFGVHEMQLGSHYGAPIVKETGKHIFCLLEHFTPEDRRLIETHMKKTIEGLVL